MMFDRPIVNWSAEIERCCMALLLRDCSHSGLVTVSGQFMGSSSQSASVAQPHRVLDNNNT